MEIVMGSPVLWLFCQLACYRETAVRRLYQQLEPPPRPVLCFLLLLLPPQLRPLKVLPGSCAGSILSSPPRIHPVLRRWNTRAEPLPSPGYRPQHRLHHGLKKRGADRDRPLKTLHTLRFCPAAACPLALFLGSRASSLPHLQASLRPISLTDWR